jgi:hypothetical protein
MIVAVDHPTARPPWLSAFRARYSEFRIDGHRKGINFSLLVAIELARRMVATARDSNERGHAHNFLGSTLCVSLRCREHKTSDDHSFHHDDDDHDDASGPQSERAQPGIDLPECILLPLVGSAGS